MTSSWIPRWESETSLRLQEDIILVQPLASVRRVTGGQMKNQSVQQLRKEADRSKASRSSSRAKRPSRNRCTLSANHPEPFETPSPIMRHRQNALVMISLSMSTPSQPIPPPSSARRVVSKLPRNLLLPPPPLSASSRGKAIPSHFLKPSSPYFSLFFLNFTPSLLPQLLPLRFSQPAVSIHRPLRWRGFRPWH